MTPTPLTADLLRTLPLPWPERGSKDERGRVLVIAGSREVPGAARLTAEASLRAGAGKLQIATVQSAAPHLAMAIPEALVIGLAETPDGGMDHPAALPRLQRAVEKVDAVALGPGMVEGEAAAALAAALCGGVSASFLFDAAALCDLAAHAPAIRALEGRVVITPHAGEMARLLGTSRAEVEANPSGAARAACELLRAVVVMKGAETHVVEPSGAVWLFTDGGIGLATSGSGDVLAGLVAGLLSRGANPVRAALWGVHLHGAAGQRLASRAGPIGFLARELAGEAPAIMHELMGRR